MSYQPIENYGIIGDMHTAALVGLNGSMDWLCFPDFNSPSIFAALLDDKKGGFFDISPAQENHSQKQFYWPDTNVLITRFLSPDGVGEITDFMTVDLQGKANKMHQVVRRVSVVRGEMTFRIRCFPALNYARDQHETEVNKNGACFRSDSLDLSLSTTAPLEKKDTGVVSEFKLKHGESVSFVLQDITRDDDCLAPMPEGEIATLFQNTIEYWRDWVSQSTYAGRWREMVNRSALVLKLLTYEPTGAIIAAPTCGLPGGIGGKRNFDYRYTWLRDAAFTVYAFLRIGFTREAADFINWLEDRLAESDPGQGLQVMYGIKGGQELKEEDLTHFAGYRKSNPVQVGNRAFDQFQLDIYGELMDSIYLFNKHASPISYELWQYLRRLLNWVCDNWRKKDRGIWEFRDQPEHYVYSKLMCWVALDRGVRLAEKRSFPAPLEKWRDQRDRIHEEIMQKGWNEERQAFVQAYGGDILDASNLMMPLVLYVSPTDPRILKTIEAIRKPPEEGGLTSGSLIYRYNIKEKDDRFKGGEGTFNICTFWLVEALTRAGRFDHDKLTQAQLLFERMLAYANHLGLYSEETGKSGEALGNFPQAYTHLSLISSAFNLDRALGRKRP